MPWGFGSSHSHRSDSRERNQPQKELVHAKDASIGVKVVYTPPEGIEATVDIVAVHGLMGDAFRTWTVTQKSGKEIFWLRDMLPAEVPNARVLTYGYDSDPGKMFDSASTNMVHHHATTLVSELHYFRRKPNERHRPIIFVCHSLGGIVVKRALIYSSTCNISHNPELRSIKVSTYGIVFLGTPHMGADHARWGKMAEMLVRMLTTKNWVDSNDALIAALGKNSETLQNITDNFVGLSSQFRQFFFWEELKMHIPGMTRDVIVDYSSAVPESLPDAQKAAIHATHTEMCKFSDENSPGWNILAGVLISWCELAPTIVEQNWQLLYEQEHLDIGYKIRGTIHGRRTPSPAVRALDSTGSTPERVGGIQRSGLLTGGGGVGLDDSKQPPRLQITAPSSFTPFYKPPTLQENKFFVGRQVELEKIHEALTDPQKRTILVSSVTGCGKTHLARQYFFTKHHEYPGGAFWIDCKAGETGSFSTEVLDFWYSAIFEDLLLHLEDDNPRNRVKEVVTWFNQHTDWLIVFDGVDIDTDAQYDNFVKTYIPSVSGSIIYTSINATLAGSARLGSPRLLSLPPPLLDEAVAMLEHYSHGSAAPSASSTNLCRALTCLPLAIYAAANYIKDVKLPISEYLVKYQRRPFVEREYLGPFHVVFDRIESQYPQAAGLLRVLSFWGEGAGGGVPVQMLWWGVKSLRKEHRELLVAKQGGRGTVDVDISVGQCLRFAVMERGLEEGFAIGVDTLRLHHVAKDVCIARMKADDELGKWSILATEVFCNSFEYLESRRRRRFSNRSDDSDGKKTETYDFLTSDYARYLTHGTHILDRIRRHKLDTLPRLESVIAQVQQLTNAESPGLERRSMFTRSGSASTSIPDMDTPSDDREMCFPLTRIESPPIVRRHSPEQQEEETREREKRAHENAKALDFEFRYEPPKGPRRGTGNGSRRGRGRTATLDSGRGGRVTLQPGQSRGRSPGPIPVQATPLLHHNPYPDRGASLYASRHHHYQYHQHSSSAPPGLGHPLGVPLSPVVSYVPSPYLVPHTPMPPYPVTPGHELQDPLQLPPRPFNPGFRPTRDLSNSPVMRAVSDVYMDRPSSAPSEVWSEPITRDRSLSPCGIFPIDGVPGGWGGGTVREGRDGGGGTGAYSLGQGFGLGIVVGGRAEQGKRNGSRLRRSSVPEAPDQGVGGVDMERSRSDTAAVFTSGG